MVFIDNIFKKDEITDNLVYFINYWEYFCKTIEQPSVFTTVMTPHYLVKEILDELKTNGTENSANLRFFLEQNEFFLKKEILFDKDTRALWILLHEKLTEKEKQELVIKSLADKLNNHFNTVQYKRNLFIKLETLINDKSKNFDSIKVLIEVIIFQFIFEQYSIKTIKEIIKQVFAHYKIVDYGNGRIVFHTNYPLATKYEDNDDEYIRKATLEMESLTLSNRFWKIFDILTKPKQDYYFIFYVKGICYQSELSFGDITFYNPKIKPIIVSKIELENDIFYNANYEIGMNVIVLQEGRDIINSKQEALKKIAKICDCFKLYDNSKANFHIYDSDYRVLDSEKKLSNWSMGRSKDQIGPYDVIRDDETIDYVKSLYADFCSNSRINEHDKKIIFDSIHFFRKAKESSIREEQLLNYWIALERIFLEFDNIKNKFERTCNFARSFLLERYIFQKGWNCYNFINSLLTTKTMHNGQFCPEIDIPKELQIEANIGEYLPIPITIELEKFINKIPEIQKYSSNILAYNMMQEVSDFYKNHQIAKKDILSKNDEIRNELLMIYRQRNQIVHNATFDETLIEFNIAQIQSIVTMVLYDLINGLKSEPSLKNVILDSYIKAEQDLYLANREDNYLFIEKFKNINSE